jgi:hypothetical protein
MVEMEELRMDVKPDIVAPVMRCIGVADTARSILFYRDAADSNSPRQRLGHQTAPKPGRYL